MSDASPPMVFTCANCAATYAIEQDGQPREHRDPETGDLVLLANLDVIDLSRFQLWQQAHVGPFRAPVPGS